MKNSQDFFRATPATWNHEDHTPNMDKHAPSEPEQGRMVLELSTTEGYKAELMS